MIMECPLCREKFDSNYKHFAIICKECGDFYEHNVRFQKYLKHKEIEDFNDLEPFKQSL